MRGAGLKRTVKKPYKIFIYSLYIDFLGLKLVVTLRFSREKYLFLFSFFLIIENIIYYGEKRELKSLVFSVFSKGKVNK